MTIICCHGGGEGNETFFKWSIDLTDGIPGLKKREKWQDPSYLNQCQKTKPRYTSPLGRSTLQ
jgi:hypothetical protein